MMKNISKIWPAILILLLATTIRFVKLNQIPSSLYYDEIDLGYQIRSFLQTGKDYRGNNSPFYFRSFNTDRTPIPVLISAVFSPIFNSPEFKIRGGTALVGVLVVLLAMLITFNLTKSKLASLITGLVFTFSPWQVHFSRLAFEAEHLLLFLLTFIFFIFSWFQTKSLRSFYFSALVLGLSIYTYRTMSFLAPALLILTPLYFGKEFFQLGIKKSLTWLFLGLAFMVPFLYATTIGSKDQTRINQISIFSDTMVPIEVQRSRELVSGNFQNSTLGQSPSFWSKVFHNKALSFIEKFRNNTFNNFSPDFLFLSGDPNGRHSAKETGELLFVDILALIFGAYYILLKIKDKRYSFILILLFLGAVPSNLTIDGANHAPRLISFSGPLLIIVSLGYYSIFMLFAKQKFGKFLAGTLIVIWLFAVLQFINNYFFHFPIINSREFGYGFKQAIQKISFHESKFQHVILTDTNDPPMLYYFYWANVPPRDIQSYGTDFNTGVTKGTYLDKIKPGKFELPLCDPKAINLLKADTLYMVSYKNLPLDFRAPDKDQVPAGIKLLEVIKYPDNEVAFYLITRDTKNNSEVLALKTQKCN